MDAIMNFMKFRDEKMMAISDQDQRLKAAEEKATDAQVKLQASVGWHRAFPNSSCCQFGAIVCIQWEQDGW